MHPNNFVSNYAPNPVFLNSFPNPPNQPCLFPQGNIPPNYYPNQINVYPNSQIQGNIYPNSNQPNAFPNVQTQSNLYPNLHIPQSNNTLNSPANVNSNTLSFPQNMPNFYPLQQTPNRGNNFGPMIGINIPPTQPFPYPPPQYPPPPSQYPTPSPQYPNPPSQYPTPSPQYPNTPTQFPMGCPIPVFNSSTSSVQSDQPLKSLSSSGGPASSLNNGSLFSTFKMVYKAGKKKKEIDVPNVSGIPVL